MKKSILIIMIAVATTSGVNARVRERTVVLPQKTRDLRMVMNSALMGNTNSWQNAINRSWNTWRELEKKDVLLRLYEEGVLSEDDVINWNMNQVPQITMGG